MKITSDQADAAYTILVNHAGAPDNINGRNREDFVFYVAECKFPDKEYRFCGSLGFGGKFLNEGDRVPVVNCYLEDRTPEREAAILATNEALAVLFGDVL